MYCTKHLETLRYTQLAMARANLSLSEEVTSAFIAAQEDGTVRGIKVSGAELGLQPRLFTVLR